MELMYLLTFALGYLFLCYNCYHHTNEQRNIKYKSIKKTSSGTGQEILALAKAFYEELQKKMHADKITRGENRKVKHNKTNTVISDTKNIKKFVEFKKHTIIDSKSSKLDGATFLAKLSVTNITNCANECKKLELCTVSIYQEQDPNQCFMFDCGTPNICEFMNQSDFTTIILSSNNPTLTTTTTTLKPSTTTTSMLKKSNNVNLFDLCTPGTSICVTSNSYCGGDFCICKHGYTHQEGECQKLLNNGPRTMPSFHQRTHAVSSTPSTTTSTTAATTLLASLPPTTPPSSTTTKATISTSTTTMKMIPSSIKPTIKIMQKVDSKISKIGDKSSKKISEKLNMTSNKTAIAALTCGLTITLILLLLVGCRLRSVKHRLRKGRPINAKEADYLINGMYL